MAGEKAGVAQGEQREKSSSILRAFAILEQVVAAERPVNPAELAAMLEIPKASAHRLCRMLEEAGLLQRALDGRRLIAGPRLNTLALDVLGGAAQRVARHAVLQRLSAAIGETCNIGIPDGAEMIYYDRVETHWPLRMQLPVGTRVPLHCTASGKLFLSSLTPAQRRRLIAQLPLVRRTPNTLTEPAALEAALERIRADQIGVDDGEFIEGMVAVAVPITDSLGRFCAGLATHAPTQRMTIRNAMAHVPVLREAAAELSATLQEAERTAEH